jgi:hypothetical protein
MICALVSRVGFGYLLQKFDELLLAVPRHASVDHLPVATSRQANSVVVPFRLSSCVRAPAAQGAAAASAGYAVTLGSTDFSSTHMTTAFLGGAMYTPDDVAGLSPSCGSVENLKVSNRHGCRSCSFSDPGDGGVV